MGCRMVGWVEFFQVEKNYYFFAFFGVLIKVFPVRLVHYLYNLEIYRDLVLSINMCLPKFTPKSDLE